MNTKIIAPKSKKLRDVWKHEAHDFTPWLADAENLKILSKAVDSILLALKQNQVLVT